MDVKFQKIAFFFIAFTALATAFPNDIHSHLNDVESDPEMEKYLREALENFREQMKDGIPAINMPRLDPLELRNLDVNVNENLATMSLKIKQITVRELSQFEAESINADLGTFYLKLKLKLPALRAQGKYALDGKLLKIFPLYGNGSFSINLTDAVIFGESKLIPTDGTLQMSKMEIDLSWNKLSIFLENCLGGGKFQQILQRLLPNVGKSVFENYKPQILSNLNSLLIKSLNDVLKKPEVKQIIEGIIAT